MDAQELARHLHLVRIPGGMEPAAWAVQHATVDPERIPEGWPESTRMCLMVIYRDCAALNHDCETHAFLVTRPEVMDHLVTNNFSIQLWFRLPRRLFTTELCPDLKPEHWPITEEQ